jgi:hypothetical protein
VKSTKIFQISEKYEDFSKWSSYNGRPVQVKNEMSF